MRALWRRCGGRFLVSGVPRQVRALREPWWGSCLSPSHCVPQVEEALVVLQAHQVTEQTTVNVPDARWVDGGGRNDDRSS